MKIALITHKKCNKILTFTCSFEEKKNTCWEELTLPTTLGDLTAVGPPSKA